LAEKENQSIQLPGQFDDDMLMEDYSPTPASARGDHAYLDDDCRLSPTLSMGDSDEEDGYAQSHVEVALLESTLNTGNVPVAGGDAQYLVAEPSSDGEEDDNKGEGKGDEKEAYDWRPYNGGVEVHEISA
jgi:hypothetical protein